MPPVDGQDNGGGHGVQGTSTNGSGVIGLSTSWLGVYGKSETGIGVFGDSAGGSGAVGKSKDWYGVHGESTAAAGVHGESQSNSGVVGVSKLWVGVYGESQNPDAGAGVWGKGVGAVPGVLGDGQNGPGIWGRGALAGRFEGNVEVTGDIRLLNADCAEEFDIAETELVEPGTVMVLGDLGALRLSQAAYDKRVAGIVSGAGDYQPALVLDRQPTGGRRLPIALMGKVFCKVDAQYGEIEIGDLLTTSPTPGHAMKADDPMKAFGSVIGKALRAISGGQGLIPVLVALQ